MTTETLAAILAADPDRLNWENLVHEGVEARRKRDGAQWELGDLAREVETSYGGGELERYAEEIGVSLDSLYRYREMATAYESWERSQLVPFAHHDAVVSRDDRAHWLSLAEESKWSLRRMLAEIEAEDERQREEEAHQKLLAELKEQSADLAEAVSKGEMPIDKAIVEAVDREKRATREKREEQEGIDRGVARLKQLLIGWIELESLPTNPRRDRELAQLSTTDRAKVLEIEAAWFGGR